MVSKPAGYENAVEVEGLRDALIGFAWSCNFPVAVYDFDRAVALVAQGFKSEHGATGDGECSTVCTHIDDAIAYAKKQYLSSSDAGVAIFMVKPHG